MPKLSQKWNVVTHGMKINQKGHRAIIKGWIEDYREMMHIIKEAKIKGKEDKLIENDWNLAYKVSELMPLYASRQCNVVGIEEEADIKQYWVMGLHLLISRNRKNGKEFHEGGLISIGVYATIDVLRKCKVSKFVKKNRCPSCEETNSKIKELKELAKTQLSATPIKLPKLKRKCGACIDLNKDITRPVTVSFAELKESADMSYKLFDYIDILGADNVLQFLPPAQDTAENKLAECD